jgi:hypothetical protein
VEFARFSQYQADCSLTIALAQLGSGQAASAALTATDLVAGAKFNSPNGTIVTLGTSTGTEFNATITSPNGTVSPTTAYPSELLVALLNGLSATKSK